MHTNRTDRRFLSSLAPAGLLALAATLASAGGRVGIGPPDAGPVAGPIEVMTMAEVISSPLGTLVESELLVANHGDEPASVFLLGQFRWPDGSTQLLRYGPPVAIDADGAVLIQALSPVPEGVGAGDATFTVTAVAGSLGSGGHSGARGPLIAQDSTAFVLP